MKGEFVFESIKNKVLKQSKPGKYLLGKDGAFAPFLENIIDVTLEGGMDFYISFKSMKKLIAA